MLLKTFSRSLLAMAISTSIAADPIVIDSLSGPASVSVTTSDSVTVVSGGMIDTNGDGIEIEGVGLNVPFINVDLGASITAAFDGIFVTGTNNTVGPITINGSITSGGGGFTDIAGVNINAGNTVNGDITFSSSSTFTNSTPCVFDLGFCDGGAVISTQGTHAGDLLLQGQAIGPVGIQLLDGATTRNLVNTGQLVAFNGFQILSGATVNGDVRNEGMLQAQYGIGISSERLVFNDLGSTGNVSEIVAGDQVTINGSVVNSGLIDASIFSGVSAPVGISIVDNVVVTGDIENSGSIDSSYGILLSRSGLADLIIDDSESGPSPVVRGDIVNTDDGVINTTFSSILLSNESTLDGTIVNRGAISSQIFSAIKIIDSSTVGGILNDATGTLNAGDDLILIKDSTVVGSIVNNGTLGATTFNGAGIDIEESTIGGGITNTGSISSQDAGIDIILSDISGGITNTTTGMITSGEGAIVIDGGNFSGGINNDGVLETNGNQHYGTVEVGPGLEEDDITEVFNGNVVPGSFSGGINNTSNGAILNTATNTPDAVHTDRNVAVLIVSTTVDGGISNAGDIESDTDDAVLIFDVGSFEGVALPDTVLNDGINNTSEIFSGGGAGIHSSGAVINGGIINSGNIEGQQGIVIDGISISIVEVVDPLNSNETLDEITAVSINTGAGVVGDINNGGLIRSTISQSQIDASGGTGPFAALNLQFGASITGDIINTGLIEATDRGAAIEIGSGTRDTLSLVDDLGVVTNFALGSAPVSTVTGNINNSGMIRAANDSAISLNNGDLNGIVNNAPGIINGQVSGIIIENSTVGFVDNGGTILGDVLDGITLKNGGIILGNIDNSGLISAPATSVVGAILLEDAASQIAGVITNSGTLMIGGASSVEFEEAAVISVGDGSVGGVVNLSGGLIDNAMFSSNSASKGIFVNNGTLGFVTNSGQINGTVDFGVNGGTFNGLGGTSGSVIGASALNIQLADGATSDTTTQINGDFTFSGPISLDVKGVSVGGVNDPVYGVLSIAGAADLTGATLDIDVTAENFIDNGTELVFLDATTLTSDITSAEDNSAVLDFTVAQQGNSLVATAQRTAFEEVIAQAPGGSAPNVQAISSSLSSELVGTLDANSELVGVVNQISILPVEEIVSAFKSLEPEAVSSSSVGAISADGASAGTVNARMTALRGTGFSGAVAGDEISLSGFWMQLYDSNTDQDTIDEVDGFEADTYGIALGLDASLDGGYNVGVAFSYADTDMDSEGAENNSLEIESYRLTAYGSYNTSGYFVDAQVAYAINQYDGTRNLFNGLRASNDHDGDQYSLRMRVGKPIALENGLFVTLKASAEYTYLNEESYSEKGAGNAGLTVDTDDVDAFVLGAGIDLAYPITTANEITWIPELSLEVQRDLIGQEIEVDSNFVGVAAAAFTTEGANVEQTGINLGLGLRAFGEGDLSVSLRADYLYKKDYKNVSGSVTVRYGF